MIVPFTPMRDAELREASINISFVVRQNELISRGRPNDISVPSRWTALSDSCVI